MPMNPCRCGSIAHCTRCNGELPLYLHMGRVEVSPDTRGMKHVKAYAVGYMKDGYRHQSFASPGQDDTKHSLRRFFKMLCALLVTVFFTALTLAAPFGNKHSYNSSLTAPLRFTSNGTFQISIFEDLHFGENAWVRFLTRSPLSAARTVLTSSLWFRRTHGVRSKTSTPSLS